jgi:EcsC protein family
MLPTSSMVEQAGGGVARMLEEEVIEGEILQGRLSLADHTALRAAVLALEHRSLAMRLAGLAGRPVELLIRMNNGPAGEAVLRLTQAALRASLRVALSSRIPVARDESGRWHKALVAISGAVGGSFGLSSLAFELPVSTTILLHAIADIARREGEDLTTPEAGLACLEVLAFAGRSEGDRQGDAGYLAVRTALARATMEAARYVAERGLVEEGAPLLLRVVAEIARRFGVTVSQKLAAQAVPLLGALAGAMINTAFMEHFQSMAKGHFTVRRLERNYGRDMIEAAFREIKLSGAPAH